MKCSNRRFEPLAIDQLLAIEGQGTLTKFYQDHLGKDKHYGWMSEDGAVYQCPPVPRLYNVYGTNVDTAREYAYRCISMKSPLRDTKHSQSGMNLVQVMELDTEADVSMAGFKCKEGILWETKDTPQQSWIEGSDVQTKASGDGTVPYLSLSVPLAWRHVDPTLNITNLQFDDMKHLDMLFDPRLHQSLLDLLTRPLRARVMQGFRKMRPATGQTGGETRQSDPWRWHTRAAATCAPRLDA